MILNPCLHRLTYLLYSLSIQLKVFCYLAIWNILWYNIGSVEVHIIRGEDYERYRFRYHSY